MAGGPSAWNRPFNNQSQQTQVQVGEQGMMEPGMEGMGRPSAISRKLKKNKLKIPKGTKIKIK
jgi:hypothetical protein